MRFNKKRQDIFIAKLIESGNVSFASNSAGIRRTSAYRFKNAVNSDGELINKEFSDAWDEAIEVAADEMVHEARRRAMSGVEKPVGWYQGVSGGIVREYSDTLLMFLIKAHRPEYRDKIENKITGDITIIKQEPGYKGSTKTKAEKKIV